MININDLEKIVQVVDKYNISRFEFQHEKSKVIIQKQRITKIEATESTESQTKLIEEEALKTLSKEDNSINEINIEKEYIKATFAGTFYSKKESDGPAFVKINDKVKVNTVVGLLEVMKLFNEVEAGIEGIIVNILVKDGEFVEYGQPLFEIEIGEKYV